MPASIFDDKSVKPESNMLYKALVPNVSLWKELRRHLEEQYGPLIEDWKFYNQKSGWQLKLLRKKRNLFFFTPLDGYFKITLIFGDKAVAVVEDSDLPEEMKETLRNARKYVEGWGLAIKVKQAADVLHVKKLVEIKLNN